MGPSLPSHVGEYSIARVHYNLFVLSTVGVVPSLVDDAKKLLTHTFWCIYTYVFCFFISEIT